MSENTNEFWAIILEMGAVSSSTMTYDLHPNMEYPENSQMIGGDRGDVWMLCGTEGTKCLRQETKTRESNMYKYPSNTKMITDGGEWRLRHANRFCKTNPSYLLSR